MQLISALKFKFAVKKLKVKLKCNIQEDTESDDGGQNCVTSLMDDPL